MMLTAATALPHPALAQDKPHHSDGMSDYLRFAPWVATYTLKAAGVEGSSSWKRCMVNSALSMGLTVGVTYTLKQTIHEKRPDGTDKSRFHRATPPRLLPALPCSTKNTGRCRHG